MLLGLAVSGWSAVPVQPVRLDNQLQSATITASRAASAARVTDPLVWQNFSSSNELKWIPLRGRVGYRNGDLMVKGEGSTPVSWRRRSRRSTGACTRR